ncbi:hypothetical protein DENSPDRAFT_884515 [Dentipellis sp. KUC8613]|nr:hypothetical protein DENSPDRAFT_884515 [Dentipellis sp. KUC8613]
MHSSSRPNRYQTYPWTGAPGQVSGSSSHATAPPATAHVTRTSATHAGYPTDGTYPSARAAPFQNPGNSTLHSSYDPDPDRSSATLESTFPYLRTPQTGSTGSITGGSPYEGFAPGHLGANFPHSNYSELANYAGDHKLAGSVSGTAQAGASSVEHDVPPSAPHNLMNNRRASAAESAKGKKRKNRQGVTNASDGAQGGPLGNESEEERVRKMRKADLQRKYRAEDREAVKKLENVLPDKYKTVAVRPGLTRQTVDQSMYLS